MKKLVSVFLFLSSIAYGQHYTTGENWVTRYLANGGDIKNVTGLVQPEGWKNATGWNDMHRELAAGELPSHFDWNDWYQLQPIKNQGSCGSCWAFSITAVMESLYWIHNGNGFNNWFDLAEQTLVSTCESGGDCGGGYFTAFGYVKEKGLPLEGDDPYRAQNSSCKSSIRPILKAVDWKYIGDQNRGPTTAQLKAAIWHYGPISVDVNGGFSNYSSGVYTSCGSTSTNHMVVLDGWTDDPAYSQYGGGYWRMRNSWGKGFGEDGYMNIVYKSRGGSNCNGVGNVGAYAVIDGLTPIMKKK